MRYNTEGAIFRCQQTQWNPNKWFNRREEKAWSEPARISARVPRDDEDDEGHALQASFGKLEWKFDLEGQVAQSVERGPEKAGVGGSIPSLATMFSSAYN